jgi:hypothetical protein
MRMILFHNDDDVTANGLTFGVVVEWKLTDYLSLLARIASPISTISTITADLTISAAATTLTPATILVSTSSACCLF